MRFAALALLVGACSFHAVSAASDAHGDVGDALDAAPDGAPDAAPAAFCPIVDHLRLCFTFNQNPLPTTLPDQGAAPSSAQLTNVTHLASPLGGAAQLGGTSEIFFPMDSVVSGILASEIWFRIDTDAPANFARETMFDSNVIPPNISMFVYRNDPQHDIHCGIGGQSESWTTSAFAVAAWHHIECVCAGGDLSLYLDGIDLGDRPGNCSSGGALVADGFTIGANNNGNGGANINDQLIGAIDGIRLWDQPPPISSD